MLIIFLLFCSLVGLLKLSFSSLRRSLSTTNLRPASGHFPDNFSYRLPTQAQAAEFAGYAGRFCCIFREKTFKQFVSILLLYPITEWKRISATMLGLIWHHSTSPGASKSVPTRDIGRFHRSGSSLPIADRENAWPKSCCNLSVSVAVGEE
jgi:hypothetical protein